MQGIQFHMRFYLTILTVLLVTCVASTSQADVVVSGDVSDAVTGVALFPATVRIAGTNTATVTNPDGRFALNVRSLPVRLVVSHIGYRSDSTTVEKEATVSVRMIPVMLELDEIVVTAEDPAISIMRKVIERKQVWRENLESLKAKAYTRLTLRKDTTIVSVIESMSDAFWRDQKGWREVLLAKRTTRNMEADLQFPAAAFMDNLYDDDVFVAGHTLQGVTHPDALETYYFELTGRRAMDDQTVYDIAVVPKSKRSSAFVGNISVLEDDYALLDVHLAPNESFIYPPPFKNFKIAFHQQFCAFDDAWLPVDLRTELGLDIGFIGFNFPPIRSVQTTRISDYEVNVDLPDSLFASPKPLISDVSSKSAPDSLLATAGVVIPLSEDERVAFEQIDRTATLNKVFKPEGALARLVDADEDVGSGRGKRWRVKYTPRVWYNRVDEGHLGIRPELRSPNGRTRIRGEIGYATGLERWSAGGEVWHFWGNRRKYRIAAGYRKGSSPRQTSNLYSNFNASTALTGGDDYFDHYWRERFFLQGRYRNRDLKLEVAPGLRVERHRSLSKTSDFAILSDFVQRPNPSIEPGDLRSLTFRMTYKDGDGPPAIVGQRKIQVAVEHSRPGLMSSDFDFTQVRSEVARRFKTFFARRMMPNVLDVTISAGFSTGTLPSQRFGHLEASLERWHNPGTFRTIHANPYEGEHYFGVFWEHHFRTLPFEYLGWDALVRRNIGLIVFGGHGRTWIDRDRLASLPYTPQYQDAFHHELGISVNGLLGLLRIDFAKRIDAVGYTVGIGFARIF